MLLLLLLRKASYGLLYFYEKFKQVIFAFIREIMRGMSVSSFLEKGIRCADYCRGAIERNINNNREVYYDSLFSADQMYDSLFLLIVVSSCIKWHNLSDASNKSDVIKLPTNKLDT